MLTLIHAPQTRSTRFLWLLEELGVPYDIRFVTIKRGDGTGEPDPANPHPNKQVPALEHDGVLITESAAIALYLTDAFPAAGVGPLIGDPLRGAYLTWLAYYAGALEPAVNVKFRGNPTEADEKLYNDLETRWRGQLEKGPYLLGDVFSAADILFGSLLQFFRSVMPEEHRVYDDYLARLNARPALARAMAKDAKP